MSERDTDPPDRDSDPPPRRRSMTGMLLAAIPAVVVGMGNYFDSHNSKEVIAQESVRVDQNVWPELVAARERIARLEEWRKQAEAQLAAETAPATSTRSVALPASPPPLPAKDGEAVKHKMEHLF